MRAEGLLCGVKMNAGLSAFQAAEEKGEAGEVFFGGNADELQ
jgi:hypothetical protein